MADLRHYNLFDVLVGKCGQLILKMLLLQELDCDMVVVTVL